MYAHKALNHQGIPGALIIANSLSCHYCKGAFIERQGKKPMELHQAG